MQWIASLFAIRFCESFESIQAIDKLEQINGLSIDVIERRAKPIQDNTKDIEEWRFRSFDGFLGESESLKQVLKEDWLTVEKLQTTHIELANKLKQIINETEKIRLENGFGIMKPIQISFQYSPSHQQQLLEVEHHVFNGDQFSPFWNDSKTSSKWNFKWREEYIIRNTTMNLHFKLAGNTSSGLIPMIESLGFYEGGQKNNYRVDPLVAHAVLSGTCTPQCIELVMKRPAYGWEDLEAEIKYCQDRLQENNNETFSLLTERVEFLKTEIKKKRQEAEEQIILLKKHV